MSDCYNEFEFSSPQGTFYMDGGIRGKDGVTFYPHVSAAGILSWTNDGGKQNPDPVDIKGEDGMSAYAAAQQAGFTGTEQEFNAYLAGIGELTDDVDNLKSAFDGITEKSSINIFDEQYPNSGTLDSTGQLIPNANYNTSDFVPIDSSNVYLYVLRTNQPYVVNICWYSNNTEETVVGTRTAVFSASASTLRVRLTINQNARFFRITRPVSAVGGICLSYIMQSEYVPYELVTMVKDSAIDVDRKVSEWYAENFNSRENIVAMSSPLWVNTIGQPVYDMVLDNPVSYKCQSVNNSTDIRLTLSNPVNLIGVQAFELVCYVENAENITNFTLATFTPSQTTYSRTISGILQNGWNRIRINTAQQDTISETTWSTASVFRIASQGNGEYSITIAALNLDRMEKAKLIFVDDHGYHGFKTLAYPLLKAAGQPVTWALNPGRLGEVISTHESILTQTDIDELAYDAFSEFSFHNWNPNGNPTETMTPEELRQDYQKCITYLKKNGICPGHLWRAALTQNKANNWWVAKDMVEAAATHTESSSYMLWPFDNWYNVNRIAIHSRSNADIDQIFTRLKLTHASVVLYTHGCVVSRDPNIQSDSLHCTVAEIEYLADKISTGVSEGWLEPTTFNRLMIMKDHGIYTLTDT